jgi:hypothetical protein
MLVEELAVVVLLVVEVVEELWSVRYTYYYYR